MSPKAGIRTVTGVKLQTLRSCERSRAHGIHIAPRRPRDRRLQIRYRGLSGSQLTFT